MKRAKPKKQTEAQLLLAIHLRELGVRELVTEFQIDPSRRWRADIALPFHRVLIEVDGGMRSGGHKRGAALEDDYMKQNTAQLLDWKIFRFSNAQVSSLAAKEFMRRFFGDAI